MEAIRSSETSVQSTTSTRRHTPEDGILHTHRRENLKSYNFYHVSFVSKKTICITCRDENCLASYSIALSLQKSVFTINTVFHPTRMCSSFPIRKNLTFNAVQGSSANTAD
jgi:hypothetical protein